MASLLWSILFAVGQAISQMASLPWSMQFGIGHAFAKII